MVLREDGKTYEVVITSRFGKILDSLKKKKPSLFRDLIERLEKISREPHFGKPLRNVLRNRRRIHVGSFVLLYEIHQDKIYLLDFVHHDRAHDKSQ